MMHSGHILCTVNVNCGGEGAYDIIPAKTVKKVAVVGGGPAGMEAARVAALKGHQVTLFEKRELGGRLIEASIPSFKNDLKPLIKYYVHQMTKLKNIDVVKKEVTTKDIKEGEFEAVVVAIGGKNIQAEMPSIDKSKLLQWDDALHGAEMGESILVAGGGLIGTELALYLAESGEKVAIVEMLDTIASGIETAAIGVVMGKIAELGIAVHTGQRLETITDKGAVTVDRFGNKKTFECSHVITALGFYPQRDFAAALREEPIEVIEVGDALRPGKIFDAVHGGHVAVRYL
jgi:pyruvate/2-oxoglutarate dehydrogenase complex dihydrolipoamide dehydrogenase (E3) component